MRDPDGYLIEVGEYSAVVARPLQGVCVADKEKVKWTWHGCWRKLGRPLIET